MALELEVAALELAALELEVAAPEPEVELAEVELAVLGLESVVLVPEVEALKLELENFSPKSSIERNDSDTTWDGPSIICEYKVVSLEGAWFVFCLLRELGSGNRGMARLEDPSCDVLVKAT